MKLVANYFSGSLEGYSKERVIGNIAPTCSVAVEWCADWTHKGLPVIDLIIPEWGVKAIIARNERIRSGVGFVPDNTDKLRRLVASGSANVSERLICRANDQIIYVKRPENLNSEHSTERYPNFSVNGDLDDISIEGPNDNGVLTFTSKLRFSFQKRSR